MYDVEKHRQTDRYKVEMEFDFLIDANRTLYTKTCLAKPIMHARYGRVSFSRSQQTAVKLRDGTHREPARRSDSSLPPINQKTQVVITFSPSQKIISPPSVTHPLPYAFLANPLTHSKLPLFPLPPLPSLLSLPALSLLINFPCPCPCPPNPTPPPTEFPVPPLPT